MDASTLPKNQSKEKDGRLKSIPGTYRHRDTGAIYITPDGEDGVIQADALNAPVWKDAWERIGGVPSRSELAKKRKAEADKLEAEQKAKKAEKAAEEAKKAEEVANPAPGTGVNY